jgi:hypothetical protein
LSLSTRSKYQVTNLVESKYMQIIPHLAVGFLIGSIIPNPIIICLSAFASHFLLDLVPHWDPQFDREHRGVDLRKWKEQSALVKRQVILLTLTQVGITIFLITILVSYPNFRNIILGGIFSILPDVYEWIAGLFSWPTIHFFNHKHTGWKKGFLIQLITSLTSLFPFLKAWIK